MEHQVLLKVLGFHYDFVLLLFVSFCCHLRYVYAICITMVIYAVTMAIQVVARHCNLFSTYIIIRFKMTTFKQFPSPPLHPLLTLKQPSSQLISEHWKNLVTSVQLSQQFGQSIYLIFKQKISINIICICEANIILKKSFKLLYAQTEEISCLSAVAINGCSALLLIGYTNGHFTVCYFAATRQAINLSKLSEFDFENRKQPVTSMVIKNSTLVVCFSKSIRFYHNFMEATKRELNIPTKQPYKIVPIKCQTLSFSEKVEATLYIQPSYPPTAPSLYLYNEVSGYKLFDSQKAKSVSTTIDNTISLIEAKGSAIATGDTSNNFRIIYGTTNRIQRYGGFRNYVMGVDLYEGDGVEELWVADLNGCVAMFVRYNYEPKTDNQKTNKTYTMHDNKMQHLTKISEIGFKKIMVYRNTLIALDAQSNITIYDVVRKERQSTTSREELLAELQ